MKENRFSRPFPMGVLGLLLVPALALAAPSRATQSPAPGDQIDVIGHLDLANSTVTQMKTSEHWRHQFLELQDPAHRTITLVDVTDAVHPVIVKQLDLPAGAENSTLDILVGDVALLQGNSAQPAAQEASSVSVVSFADPEHPKTVRTFNHVSALHTDQGRGLIYLANRHGLWILHQQAAPDKQLEDAYSKYVLYYH
ncbi:MAG TPA: hypothetical protein VMO17_03645 [Terriglobia bacterium]|nr:hypothetical protein [Terriglobia bacterium]